MRKYVKICCEDHCGSGDLLPGFIVCQLLAKLQRVIQW